METSSTNSTTVNDTEPQTTSKGNGIVGQGDNKEPPTNNAGSVRAPYYTYKQFKQFGVPAILYSLITKLFVKVLSITLFRHQSFVKTVSPTTTTTTKTTTTKALRSQRPSPHRKVAIVTGSNTGVGYETAKALVHDHGHEVIIACRSIEKGQQACEAINRRYNADTYSDKQQEQQHQEIGGRAVFVQAVDLSNLDSVRGFATSINAKYDKIDVLVNNAGRNSAGSPIPLSSTTMVNDNSNNQSVNSLNENEGLDSLFTTNFLGHFLLTNLLFQKLVRVVNLSSVMHHFPFYSTDDPYTNIESKDFWRYVAVEQQQQQQQQVTDTQSPTIEPVVRKTYAPSKLAALLFSIELNRRYGSSHGIESIAVNPGAVNSDIWRNYSKIQKWVFRQLYLTPQQGSTTSVAASVLDWEELGFMTATTTNGDNSDNNSVKNGDHVAYLQPYMMIQNPLTRSSSSPPQSPFPLFEMLGPYVGYTPTTPRLPRNINESSHGESDNNGSSSSTVKACQCLFDVCEELTGAKFA